jgi:hypothetical protein
MRGEPLGVGDLRARILSPITQDGKWLTALKLSTSLVALLAAALLAGSLAASGAALAGASKSAGRKCSVGSGEGYGYTYLTSLQVTGTSCATGVKVVRSKASLKGWRCTRKVLDKSPVQYDARETCRSGKRQVVYGFTQNT